MKVAAAVVVSILGVIVLVSGSIALFEFGASADANGTSGWNPWLWAVVIAGLGQTFFGAGHLVGSLLKRPPFE